MSTEPVVRNPAAGIYRSGVAARLAGVPVETLRVWERRYGVIRPTLSPGRQRLYSPVEVQRLTLIKQLVDMGHPIGAVAALPTDVLNDMRAASSRLENAPGMAGAIQATGEIRAALVGPLLFAARVAEELAGSALKVVGSCADPAAAAGALAGVNADVVVIELPTIDDAAPALTTRIKDACNASRAIILYRYAPSALIRRLRTAGHAVARASSDAVEIESICLNLLRMPPARSAAVAVPPPATEPPPPRFDDHALAELANASRTVYCECPKHLVDLVLSLGSFERYSAECANRGPDDARLHRDLERTAGHARAMIEAALARVLAAEGITVPGAAAANR
jgi:DNA-binding transcriptional MerR regulator